MKKIQLSVRRLAEFVFQSGSIDSRLVTPDRALLGAKIHRQLQKLEGDNYEAEVPLKIELERDGLQFVIEGRADGIIDGGKIDEIKSTMQPYGEIDEGGYEVHWAQAIIYAYIFADQENRETMDIQLRYYHITEEMVTTFERRYTYPELQIYFDDLLDKYLVFAQFMTSWQERRDRALTELPFPYDGYRKGQRELSIAVYRTVEHGSRLFAEAPTGIGKTMSTLFPTFKAMGEGKTDKIFYLTAKTITRQVAEDALEELRRQGLRAKTVTLVAKDKICFLNERRCDPDHCPFANGYYDRLNEALFDLLQNEDALTRETIEHYAKKHVICPFELSLDAALFCDVIIGDYNYLFDPTVYLRRFFSDQNGDYTFLVDEAHNLVDRAKKMYSADLSLQQLEELHKEIVKPGKKLDASLAKLIRDMKAVGEKCAPDSESYSQEEPFETVEQDLETFAAAAKDWLLVNPEAPGQELVLSAFFAANHFLKISELYNDKFMTLVARSDDTVLRLICLDPSELLEEKLKLGKAQVLFSATFSPMDYYAGLLGGADDEETSRMMFPSPFDPNRLKIIVDSHISTRYHARKHSNQELAETLAAFADSKQGNYLFFFPSYRYMEDVYQQFRALRPDIKTIIQAPDLSETEREAFLAEFQPDNEGTFVGFGILGGLFSEGVDLKGERLIGTAVVGVGLAQPSAEQELVKAYHDEQSSQGFHYAYQIPGMNKVLQAGGRVIRGETDLGALLLIDDRYTERRYQELFPRHWQQFSVVHSRAQLKAQLASFWESLVH
ncbi:ATP-dependent DNA helicase [Listeria ilorinensis]|uniref:ATP-dependent DNA helicase n=1 Tax=Listeria ilorinensis TaxID=2867439 RepID=UPI001EF71C23|nr:ATP-dependent DNA helicase [Listeria ilorinensis]